MIDRWVRPLIDPPLVQAGRMLAISGIGADAITIGACTLGLGGAVAIAFGELTLALLLLVANRIADGLDGAVARATQATDRGAFLDIVLDFAVYAAVPLGFAVLDRDNALAAAFLLASFLANGGAFLAFSALAQKRGLTTADQGQKSIYYLAGLAEGFETVAFMIAVCLFPTAFPLLAAIFAALCCLSATARVVLGWKLLS